MIPIVRVQLGAKEVDAAREAIESGWVSHGPRCIEFEARIAEQIGVKYGRAVNSCTNAILLSLLALGVQPNDEVIVPAFTCVAALNPIRLLGAVPIPVDVDLVAFGMDVPQLENAITDRTRGVLFAHLFGLAADVASVRAVCKARGLWLIEDIALGFGATDGDRAVGSVGDVAVLSFHPRKLITTGEGGMVVTDNASLAEAIASLRNYGASRQAWDRHNSKLFDLPGYAFAGLNCKLTDIQGAIGVEQAGRVSELIGARAVVASRYDEAFADLDWAMPISPRPGTVPTWQSYVLRISGERRGFDGERAANLRDALFHHLDRYGVASVQAAQAMHRIAFYADHYDWRAQDFPSADAADRTTLCLPIFPSMSDADIGVVIEAVRSFSAD